MTAVTERDCLRNVQRRTGRQVPPTAESIAKPLTDDEMQEMVCGLLAILIASRSSRQHADMNTL